MQNPLGFNSETPRTNKKTNVLCIIFVIPKLALKVNVIILFQIFYDLVRQINKKSPEKKQNKKKKSLCALL